MYLKLLLLNMKYIFNLLLLNY